MKPKGIAVIVGVAAVILVVVFLPTQPGDVPPSIDDNTQVEDSAMLGIESGPEQTIVIDNSSSDVESVGSDAPTLSDRATIETEAGVNFYIDENGTKTYIIDAVDSPIVGE